MELSEQRNSFRKKYIEKLVTQINCIPHKSNIYWKLPEGAQQTSEMTKNMSTDFRPQADGQSKSSFEKFNTCKTVS